MIQDGEEYKLSYSIRVRGMFLRSMGKYTIVEIAEQLSVSPEDLSHDFELQQKEFEDMDD